MKIIYDHQVFSKNKYGGVGKYFCEIMKNLPANYEYQLPLLFSNNQHLKDGFAFFKKLYLPIPTNSTSVAGVLRREAYNINKYYSKRIISSNSYDILHPTYFDPYFLDSIKKPYIITVHDLIAFLYKDLYKNDRQLTNMTKIIRGANRIISISENTKKDLIEILNINPDFIDVIHHGFNKPEESENCNQYGRYILYVAARWGYKNFLSLAKAFSKLKINDPDLKLICVGPPFSENEVFELKNLNIFENTLAMGVSEKKLNQLYANALAFIYPSFYEGFGMSILEAFANNCPVCLSNTSSLPEVAENAGVYFDPNDPDSILKAIEKVIYDKQFSKKMVALGNDRLNKFSWQKCTQQTIKSYEKALS